MHLNITIWFFGFISGFLLLVTGNTLNYWLAKEGCNLEVIGFFSLVSLPYAINFLWAPFLDRVKLSFIKLNINNRLKWIIALHVIGAFLLASIGLCNPNESPKTIAIIAVILSFINSSQDIVLNSLRTEITPQTKQGSTSGIYIFGYRCGMIVTGPVAIFASQFISWQSIYSLFALIYLSFPVILFLIKGVRSISEHIEENYTKKMKLKSIFSNIGTIKTIIMLLVFLALYRIADNFIGIMLNPFLIDHGFTDSQISLAGKLCGVAGSAVGGLFAGSIMSKYSITQCLLWFGVIHAFSHASYLSILYFGKSTNALLFSTISESITGGMTMAAYIGLLTSLCHGKYRATQYAILSAMMGASRTILPSFAGYIVVNTNWVVFFAISIIMVIPSIIILKKLEPKLLKKIHD